MIRQIVFIFILASFLLGSAAQSTPPQQGADKLADGPGEKIVEKACVTCHALRTVTSKRASEDEWAEEVDKMVSRGAVLSDEETDQVVEYLSTHYGPDNSKEEHRNAPESPANSLASGKTAPPVPSSETASSPPPGTPIQVNINKAGVQELQSLLGISETEAQAIVHHREQHGDFKTWQEVSSVPGVPVEKIRDNQKRLLF